MFASFYIGETYFAGFRKTDIANPVVTIKVQDKGRMIKANDTSKTIVNTQKPIEFLS